ncbi:hypothetical protein GGD65_008129 [Bradyrhizobium sp. CIR18]|nr:hypothetical protein [Bradyrhizobium sp. CIR18]
MFEVGTAKEAKLAKKPKKASAGQKEMLMPIAGAALWISTGQDRSLGWYGAPTQSCTGSATNAKSVSAGAALGKRVILRL